TSYRCRGKRLDYFPTDAGVVGCCRPHYETFEGWRQETAARDKDRLPARAAAYVSFLEELIGCRIELVSTGPERSAMVRRA
ncbi:MAG: adenylosuccinate synthetase, partial [Candidatus Krumholzibacteriia bacterium]